MTERERNNILHFLIFLAFLIIVIGMFTACGSQKESTTTVITKVDSTALMRSRQQVDSLQQISQRLRTEKTTIETELATLLSQPQFEPADTALPVKQFRRESGPHYFEARYQGNILGYSFYIAPRQNVSREITDSASYYKSLYQLTADSLQQIGKTESSTEVEKLVQEDARSGWQKFTDWLRRLVPWWVYLLAGFILGAWLGSSVLALPRKILSYLKP